VHNGYDSYLLISLQAQQPVVADPESIKTPHMTRQPGKIKIRINQQFLVYSFNNSFAEYF